MITWADVDDLVVVPSLFGRYVRVGREVGKPITLAAPREGLFARRTGLDEAMAAMRALADENGTPLPEVRTVPARGVRTFLAALLVVSAVLSTALSAPWLDPWWPTRHEATKLPRACDLIDAGTRDRLIPGWTPPCASNTGGNRSVTADCTLRGRGTELELQTALERRSGYHSGTRMAAREFVVDSPLLPGAVPVAGLGDEASRRTSVYQGVTMTRLLVRRGNVLVAVDYSAKHPAAQLVAETDALARTVLSRIPSGH